ncbi:MAG: GAF domain-containing protein [Burkholderiales bacterium]|nr:GAF domain-containing protein [Burkholderiales bacterium]
MKHSVAPGPLPSQPFFSTPQQRLALARQRYFDDGVRPSGLVSETVIQSWSRCMQSHRSPIEHVAFNPVTPSRIHSALARSQLLLQAAATDLAQLENTLSGTACTAILTDPQGVVVHSTRSADHGEVLLPLARRVGVSLDEEHIGTGAPGVTLRTGRPCTVLGGEHFFGHMQVLHCAAAPIRDVQGRIAAVLDLTCESRPFGFDAAAVVALYATTIENQLLRAQSTEHIVVHLQTSPALLGTPMEGLAGLDANGRIAWVNNVAACLLGMLQGEAGISVDDVFGIDANRLARLTCEPGATMHRLPNGLTLWLAARMQTRDGGSGLFQLRHAPANVAAPAPAPATAPASAPSSPPAPAPVLLESGVPPAATLRDSDRDLIARTVQACGGNVSQAARRLGVSRGRVYRHLKQVEPAAPS